MNEQRLRAQRRAILVSLYVLFVLSAGVTVGMGYLPPGERSADIAARIDLLLAIFCGHEESEGSGFSCCTVF
jgi:hypothetical protein